MSDENGTDLGAGQAVPSLNQRGSDDFAAMLSGDTGGGNGGQQTQVTETTEVAGNNERPELTQTTIKKPAGAENVQQGSNQQGNQQTQQTQQTAPVAPAGLDKSILDQIVETATRTASAVAKENGTTTAQVKRDQKELTPEEFNAKYQIPEVNEATIQAILDADPKKGAAMLRQLLIRTTGSSVLMAKDIVDRQLAQIREEMSPHITSWQDYQREQREIKHEAKFYSAHPDLVNEKPLVKEMQDAIFGRIASGQLKPFNSPEDAFKAVSDATRAVLTRMGKATNNAQTQQSSTQTSQSQTSQGQGSSRQMAAASTAGQSGTGRAAGKSDEESIFGKDWV